MTLPQSILTLQHFLGPAQRACVRSGLRGEERQYFADKMLELAGIVTTMPVTGQTDGQGDDAIVHLHYFAGGRANAWITEKDMEGGAGQHQAFGYADLGMGMPELGYISLVEWLENGAELDFHWQPRTLREVKLKQAA